MNIFIDLTCVIKRLKGCSLLKAVYIQMTQFLFVKTQFLFVKIIVLLFC